MKVYEAGRGTEGRREMIRVMWGQSAPGAQLWPRRAMDSAVVGMPARRESERGAFGRMARPLRPKARSEKGEGPAREWSS